MGSEYSLQLIDGSNITLNELASVRNSGGSIIRSGHIGNFNGISVFLSNGIATTTLLHEHQRADIDEYEPSNIIINQKRIPIATPTDKNLLYLKFLPETPAPFSLPESIKDLRYQTKNPAQLHQL